MTEQLEGIERRVFRSLLQEYDRNTVEAVRVELTRGREESYEDVEAAMAALVARGYVEEHAPGEFSTTSRGRAVQRSLLGETIT